MIKDVKTSPNGNTIIFTSLGHIYKKTLPNGIPARISNLSDFEADPSFLLMENLSYLLLGMMKT